MEVILSKRFKKSAQLWIQQRPSLREKIEDCIYDFSRNDFESPYYRKPLKGYRNFHELELGGDMRIIVEVLIIDDIVKFLNIGTHSQLNTTGTGKIRIS